MKVNKESKTNIYVTREDGIKCQIYKVKNTYQVYRENIDTGYKFRSLKKALEYTKI